jgi:hypothetical protein
MLNKWIEKAIRKLLPELIVKQMIGTYVLNPNNQYMLVVRDDETAIGVQEACLKHLDITNGPRMVVIVASSMELVTIVKSVGQNP